MENQVSYLNRSYNQLIEELGRPTKDMITIIIWKKESSVFVGGFSNISNEFVLSKYIEIDFDFRTLSSNIDPVDTTDNVLKQIEEQADINDVFDIGSGYRINAKICNDGNIVIWRYVGDDARVSIYDYTIIITETETN